MCNNRLMIQIVYAFMCLTYLTVGPNLDCVGEAVPMVQCLQEKQAKESLGSARAEDKICFGLNAVVHNGSDPTKVLVRDILDRFNLHRNLELNPLLQNTLAKVATQKGIVHDLPLVSQYLLCPRSPTGVCIALTKKALLPDQNEEAWLFINEDKDCVEICEPKIESRAFRDLGPKRSIDYTPGTSIRLSAPYILRDL